MVRFNFTKYVLQRPYQQKADFFMDYKELSDILTNAGFRILLNYNEHGGSLCDKEIETPLILKLLYEKDEKKLRELHTLIKTGSIKSGAGQPTL